MSKCAFTVKVFGIYLFILGFALILIPNLLLSIFRMSQTSEVWIRVVGVLVFNIGVYYWYAAKCESKVLFRVSVFTRMFVFASFIAFVTVGFCSPVLIIFGAVDFAGGIWTYLNLQAANP